MTVNKASHVPGGLHLVSKLVAGSTGLWKTLGNMETSLLGKTLQQQEIEKPVFVTSVARSGTTILTEIISQHPSMASHHYSDFPMTWIPYWWNSLRRNLPLPEVEPQERAHKDRLMITSNSPEAVEEVLWMHFFPAAHELSGHHLIDATQSHARFEAFYQDHIRKLLMVRAGKRYLAKGNYNVTRLEYLLKLFPDARFVIPIREPVQHVASLIKQHRLFTSQSAEDARVSKQLKLSGHFEFGPGRCPVIVDRNRVEHYQQSLDDVAWYASQWADIYGFVQRRINQNPALSEACYLLPYEVLCTDTKASLSKLFSHLDLDDDVAMDIVRSYETRLTQPSYYQSGFSAAEEALIHQITDDVSKALGRLG